MENKDHRGDQDQLNEHSLPGTNQAGKGPGAREEDDPKNRSSVEVAPEQDRLEEHSLPGTNQAGKGPTKPDPADT